MNSHLPQAADPTIVASCTVTELHLLKQIHRALTLTQDVHSMFATLDLRFAPWPPGVRHHGDGGYGAQTRTIYLADNANMETIVHEIGHAIDHQLAQLDFMHGQDHDAFETTTAAETDSPLHTWWTLIEQTPSLRAYNDENDPTGYWRSPQEVWARAYVQYIYTQCRIECLISPELTEDQLGRGPLYNYWPAEEFAPVADALQALLPAPVQRSHPATQLAA